MKSLQIYKQKLNLRTEMTNRTLMTTKNVAIKLLDVMREHIGKENPISRDDLFFDIYGQRFKGDMGDYVRWDFLKKGMSYVRKHSKAFIVFDKIGTEYYYFVAKKFGDEKYYVDFLNASIKKMKSAQKRVKIAIIEKHYRQNWELDTIKRRAIK